MEKKDIREVLEKVESGEFSKSDEEIAKLWLFQLNTKNMVHLSEEQLEGASEKIWTRLNPAIAPIVKSRSLWLRAISVAAILIVMIGAGLFFYTSYYAPRHPELVSGPPNYTKDINPGSNKAVLTLSNGKQIILTDAHNGTIANQSGIQITKTASGQVIYTMLSLAPPGRTDQREFNETKNNNKTELDAEGSEGQLNTITTPRGGQYQVHLPDGSKVWLNAASSLKYPVTFSGLAKRTVELQGEAYFEVSKDKLHPFVVLSGTQQVMVLGTHFNISSYGDQKETKTTLLEGSVKVTARTGSKQRSLILKPAQQASVTQNDLQVKDVDPEDAVAWKNGYFMFNNQKLEVIMQQISNWYNVKVFYEDNNLKHENFYGSISKYNKVSKVLALLEKAGSVHFEIRGNTIIVRAAD